ncbi:hypothetical protein U9M48_007153 [Paspalum notatum var. saurae]|uniref:40S ribosomal protein S27 n=1 Tax=Paspalum notatum var. saurae TaxID=547442 RepID=A0AAQ3Q1A2_PASNO
MLRVGRSAHAAHGLWALFPWKSLDIQFHLRLFPSSPSALSPPPPPRLRPLPSPVLQNDIDLLNPPAELEKLKHKKKRLVQSPNSFFMDVKCQGCFSITTVFSHSQTVVVCPGCQTVLCQPTGGKARLTEGYKGD